MEFLIEIITITFLLSAISLYNYFHDKNGVDVPSNWPLVGMLPAILKNVDRIHDFLADILEKTQLTFRFNGPWFTNMHILVTSDPKNVHHIMSRNFENYPKGIKFKELFDVLGDGIINSDSNEWQSQRKMALSFINHPKFQQHLVKKTQEIIEHGLIPILDHVCEQGIEVDLQELLGKFAFDATCGVIMNYDPKSLSLDSPIAPVAKAMEDMEHAIAYRHALPQCVWKLQRWLGVGQEKRYKEAWKILDDFVFKCIATKREELNNAFRTSDDVGIDLLTLYMNDESTHSNIFLRDTLVKFLVAGRDGAVIALSWFFYVLSKNQHVVSKIREELNDVMMQKHDDSRELYIKFVYLHAALCEALRIYPPLPFEASKYPVKTDVLPSGHKVEPNVQIIISMYAMGRMKAIWGDDCCEFKPERWISEKGMIKHVPSYKFLVFNAGPRSCLGKDMAITQMKAVAATIIRNYDIVAVEGHPVVPDFSIFLHMKHGFKVKVVRLQ